MNLRYKIKSSTFTFTLRTQLFICFIFYRVNNYNTARQSAIVSLNPSSHFKLIQKLHLVIILVEQFICIKQSLVIRLYRLSPVPTNYYNSKRHEGRELEIHAVVPSFDNNNKQQHRPQTLIFNIVNKRKVPCGNAVWQRQCYSWLSNSNCLL